MATDFKLPELGEGISGADVLRVLVAEGDPVAREQPVLEVETDKATLEVPSTVAGTVTGLRVSAGDHVDVGQVLFSVSEAGDVSVGEGAGAEPRTAEAAEAPAEEHPHPSPPPSRGKGQEPSAEPGEPEQAVAPAPQSSPLSGRGQEATPPPPREPTPLRPTALEPGEDIEEVEEADESEEGAPVFAAPLVRRFAREIGVDVRRVAGSGPRGRISIDDVKRHARESGARGAASRGVAAEPRQLPPLPDFSQWGQTEREPLTLFRRTVARRMALSWSQIPHATLVHTADVTELEAVRLRYRQQAADLGGNLTVSAMMLKIVASALKAHPRFNASFDEARRELVLKRYYHVGVAVDTDRGLVVPVVRDVDQKNIIQLAVELEALSHKARAGTLSIEETSGGTFTVINLGGLGTGHFAPIVNYPEVAVLGLGRHERVPAYVGDTLEPRLRMPLSLSFDHRAIDGADAAGFLSWIVEAIDQPLLLALEG